MEKLLFLLFCILNLTVFTCASEYEEDHFNNLQVYDLNALFSNSLNRLQHAVMMKNQIAASINNLQFHVFDPDFELRQHGNLMQKSKCLADILFTIKNYKNTSALQMFDSFGKLESGILQGNLKWIGDYDECIQIRSSNPRSTMGNFNGKYCSVSWNLLIQNVTATFVNGICVPDSCSPSELKSSLQFFHGIGSMPNNTQSALNVKVACKPTEQRHLNSPAIAVIALLSVFTTLAVLGTSITGVKYFKGIMNESKDSCLVVNVLPSDRIGDVVDVESDDELLLQNVAQASKINVCLGHLETFLNCFCLISNGAKLLNTNASEGQLLCIHGIRFLSMSWIILGHTYGFGILETRNIAEAIKVVDDFNFQIVLQGFYAVDSFFVISGFLLAYLTMKEFDRNRGRISWFYFYIHRYIRLTPIYMIVLGFSASVYFYFGSGPFWPDGDFDPICKDYWWYNLLYINNFISMNKMCMGWSWYLANDMQFFVISPIFLISLFRWPKVGYVLLSLFLCACWLSNFFITYHYELIAGLGNIFTNPTDAVNAMSKFMLFFDKIYVKPYTRISPYLIGILVGYLLFKNNSSNKRKHSWVFICIGWIVATIITLTCIYCLYHSHPTVLGSSFYNALNRTGFALGLCWVIYICLVGQAGIVNSILSFKLFIPLSRLTYTAYLIHPIILSGYYMSLKATLEFSHPTMVIIYLGVMVATYGLSLPIALILEYPIASLEKLVIRAFQRRNGS